MADPTRPHNWDIPFPDTHNPSLTVEITPEMGVELEESIKGEVIIRDTPKFAQFAHVFNRGLRSPAQILVRPVSSQDVSKIVLFCMKYKLSPSVKAGGFGTHCWSVAGDVVIDLGAMREMDFDTQSISVREWSQAKEGKGKGKAVDVFPIRKDREDSEDDSRRLRQKTESDANSESHAPPRVLTSQSGRGLLDISIPSPTIRMPGFGHVLESPSSAVSSGLLSLRLSRGSMPFSFGTSSHSQFEFYTPPTASPSFFRNPYGMPSSVPFTLLPATPSNSSPFSFGSPSQPPSVSSVSIIPGSGSPFQSLAYEYPHAYVLVSPGVTQKLIDAYTSSRPCPATTSSGEEIMVPYHVPLAAHPVGSAVMLLGGFGFCSRLRGLSLDNLVEVEMVLPDGRIVIVNESENPDLWWAIRGAGPAFGIVTRYVIKAYPCPIVFAGNILYKFNPITTPSLISHYRDTIKSAPRCLYANLLLTAGPPGQPSIVVIQLCFLGPRSEGQSILDAILSWPGEHCILNEVAEKSFSSQLDSVERVLRSAGGEGEGGMDGRSWFLRSEMIKGLSDEMIGETVRRFAQTTDGCTWLFELAGGAMTDFTDSCLAQSTREAAFTVVAFHKWPSFGGDEDCIRTGEEWITEVMEPNSAGGPLPCFAERCERISRVIGTYGRDNFVRLCELKAKYDPDGMFRHCLWPLDGDGKPVTSVDAQGLERTFDALPRARPKVLKDV